jgi:hypothetical protein
MAKEQRLFGKNNKSEADRNPLIPQVLFRGRF